jgi:hypothetical protein
VSPELGSRIQGTGQSLPGFAHKTAIGGMDLVVGRANLGRLLWCIGIDPNEQGALRLRRSVTRRQAPHGRRQARLSRGEISWASLSYWSEGEFSLSGPNDSALQSCGDCRTKQGQSQSHCLLIALFFLIRRLGVAGTRDCVRSPYAGKPGQHRGDGLEV